MSAPPSGPPPPYGDSAYPPATGYPQQGPPQPGYAPPPAGYPQPQPGPYPQGTAQYPAQYVGYPPGAQPVQGPTMVVTQPTVVTTVVQQRLGDGPTRTTCPHCKADIVTAVEYSSGLLTWLIAGGLCLFACWLGCCLIPFCVDACKDVSHSCPNCKQFISRHSRI